MHRPKTVRPKGLDVQIYRSSFLAADPIPSEEASMAATPPTPAPPRILLAGDAHGRLHQLFKRVKSVTTPSPLASLSLPPLTAAAGP